MDTQTLLKAGKVPRHLLPWGKGQKINACVSPDEDVAFMFDVCLHGLQFVDMPFTGYGGYTVMDDSDRELSRHLQAVKHAKGRILKTGLGFGCFVRMCLTKPEVEHIDVIEINANIIKHFGAEFEDDPRVTIHHCDALDFEPGNRHWHLGWHDIYTEGNGGLQLRHGTLIKKSYPNCDTQGAWAFPRFLRRLGNII